MNPEPRLRAEYGARQVEAARRVLVDIGQVLAAFRECLVVVGGWVPDLLIEGAEEPHVGSIDVDLALDAEKLKDGRYAELLGLLLETRRYRAGRKSFQLLTDVDLGDGGAPVEVEVEFLAPQEVELEKHKPKLLPDFRVLQADGCASAFRDPVEIKFAGHSTRGAQNTVSLRVVSLPDFIIMKAHALDGRDKPKDAYDICYCLGYFPEGIEKLAVSWRERREDRDVIRSVEILREKFATVDGFGPLQIVEFLDVSDAEEKQIQARRTFELVQKFVGMF